MGGHVKVSAPHTSMLLFELFDDGGQMMNTLRQTAIDIITPMLGQNVPFVTMHQMIATLRNADEGSYIDSVLVKKILDPNIVKAVSKIEGDRIYLNNEKGPEQENNPDNEQKKKDEVQKTAQDQAKKEIQKS